MVAGTACDDPPSCRRHACLPHHRHLDVRWTKAGQVLVRTKASDWMAAKVDGARLTLMGPGYRFPVPVQD